MTATKPTTGANEANVEVGQDGAHDRVAMLSLKADGTPDQLAPEIIGDKEFATKATERQFAEQAVSAVDEAARRAADTDVVVVNQDPTVAALTKEHDKVAAAAEKKAAEVVEKLHKG